MRVATHMQATIIEASMTGESRAWRNDTLVQERECLCGFKR